MKGRFPDNEWVKPAAAWVAVIGPITEYGRSSKATRWSFEAERPYPQEIMTVADLPDHDIPDAANTASCTARSWLDGYGFSFSPRTIAARSAASPS